MEISVIIPTFTPGSYIFDCLDSIRNQSFNKDKFEVIIVLNGPKDPFYNDLLRYVEGNKILNFLILYTEIKGVSHARNLALDNIYSKYIVFMDDDDIVTSNYLEALYNGADEDVIAVSNVRTFREDLDDLGDDYISKCFKRLKYNQKYDIFKYRGFLSSVWGKIIPAKTIGENRFNPNFKIGEDSLFIFSISNRIKKIAVCEDNVIYYRRIRDGSATRSSTGIDETLINAFNSIISYTRIYLYKPFQYSSLVYFSRSIAIAIEVFNRLKISDKSYIKNYPLIVFRFI